jgi:hypothetical protein
MKITVHLLAADDSGGTHAEAFATDAESVTALLEAYGLTDEEFVAWQAETGDNETGLWDFLEARGSKGDLDTYNLDEIDVDFDLCAQPLPATGKEQVAEAIECLQRARKLLKAADNRRTLNRVRLALSSAKGAARIQASRAVRAESEAANA